MILIRSVDEKTFSLNGVNFAKIYQPLKVGSSEVGLFNVYDSNQNIATSSPYGDYNIDGVVYESVEATVKALLSVVYDSLSGSITAQVDAKTDKGGYAGSTQDLKNELDSKQFEGLVSYQNEAALLAVDPVPADGTPAKVVNDPDESKNGGWTVNAGVWVQDSRTVENSVRSNDFGSAPSGAAVYSHVENLNSQIKTAVDTGKLVVKNDNQTDNGTSFDVNGESVALTSIEGDYDESNNAVEFSGTEKLVVDQPQDFTNGGTILAEIYAPDWSNSCIVSSADGTSPTDGFYFYASSTGGDNRVIGFKCEGSTTVYSNDLTLSAQNNWINVAVVVDSSGEVSFYFNGLDVGIASGDTAVGVLNTLRNIVVGNLNNSGSYNRPLDGKIRRVEIFERAFSSYEVGKWNARKQNEPSIFQVDFRNVTNGNKDAVYWKNQGGVEKFRQYVDDTGELIQEKFNADSQAWEKLDDYIVTNRATIKNESGVDGDVVFDVNGESVDIADIDAEFREDDGAFRFTGTQKLSSSQPLDFLQGGTILVELNGENENTNSRILSNSLGFSPAADGFEFAYSTTGSDRVIFVRAMNSTVVYSANMGNVNNTWIKVAAVIQDDGEVSFYLNGSPLSVASGSTAIGVMQSTRPVIVGNLDNNGSFDSPLNGSIRRVSIFKRPLSSSEVSKWNNRTLGESGDFQVDFTMQQTAKRDALYFQDENGVDRYRRFVDSNGDLRTEKYDTTAQSWSEYTEEGQGASSSVVRVEREPRTFESSLSSDGWSGGETPIDIQDITSDDFEYINTGADISGQSPSVDGEAFHGLAASGDWLMQPPQDYNYCVFYNTATGERKELDVSAYVRAIPVSGQNHRDKFNGAGASHGGRFIWVAPSWTTHALKIDTLNDNFTIAQDFQINTTHNDAYNGVIITNKYAWMVTHSKEDLPRINLDTGAVDIFPITEETAGDYNMNEASVANNRSFLGGSASLDGHIYLHPRRSKYLVKVNEETGQIVAKWQHPLAGLSNPNSGYFHGATMVGKKIYFAPWGYKNLVIFDTVAESWQNIGLTITGSSNYNFGACNDGVFAYFPPYRSGQLVKVDTRTDEVFEIDATAMINAYIAGKDRTAAQGSPDNGFAGGCLFKNGHIWFSSSFESCYIKLPVREIGAKQNVSSINDVVARNKVKSASGEVLLGNDNWRIIVSGSDLLFQRFESSNWVTKNTISA